jgi:hypothetical protein
MLGTGLIVAAVVLGLMGGDSGPAQVTPGGGGGPKPGGGGGPLTGGGAGCPIRFFPKGADSQTEARKHDCLVLVLYRGEGAAFMGAARDAQEVPGQPCTAIVATNDAAAVGVLPAGMGWGVQALTARKDYDGFLIRWQQSGSGASELIDAIQEGMLQASMFCELVGPGGEEPEPPTEPAPEETDEVILQVLDEHTAETPTPGMLFQLRPDDNPTKIAREALGVPSGHPDIAPYLRAMVQSRYNWTSFATQPRNVQPGYHGGGQIGGTWGDLSAAYLPMHESPRDAALAGRYPRRRVSWNRGPNGEYFTRFGADQLAGPPRMGRIFLPTLGPDGKPVVREADDPDANPMELLAAFGVDVDELTEAVYAAA